jgi:hypothetical protein
MDIGCGTGSLLETLVIPPSTIYEPPITQKPIKSNTDIGGPSSYGSTSGSSQADDEEEEEEEDVDRELFILVRFPLRHFRALLPVIPFRTTTHPSF